LKWNVQIAQYLQKQEIGTLGITASS
jgi:hypothetical protein